MFRMVQQTISMMIYELGGICIYQIERLENLQVGGPIGQALQYVLWNLVRLHVRRPVWDTFGAPPEGLFRSGMYGSIWNGPGRPMNGKKMKKRVPRNSAPTSFDLMKRGGWRLSRTDGRVKRGLGPSFRIALWFMVGRQCWSENRSGREWCIRKNGPGLLEEDYSEKLAMFWWALSKG